MAGIVGINVGDCVEFQGNLLRFLPGNWINLRGPYREIISCFYTAISHHRVQRKENNYVVLQSIDGRICFFNPSTRQLVGEGLEVKFPLNTNLMTVVDNSFEKIQRSGEFRREGSSAVLKIMINFRERRVVCYSRELIEIFNLK